MAVAGGGLAEEGAADGREQGKAGTDGCKNGVQKSTVKTVLL